MKAHTAERISREEYEQLTQLAAQCRRLMESALGLASRLRPATRQTSARGQVRSRLDCVVHDRIVPAARDLNAIIETAARHLEDDGEGE